MDIQIKQFGLFDIKVSVREVVNYMMEVEERNCQMMDEVNNE